MGLIFEEYMQQRGDALTENSERRGGFEGRRAFKIDFRWVEIWIHRRHPVGT